MATQNVTIALDEATAARATQLADYWGTTQAIIVAEAAKLGVGSVGPTRAVAAAKTLAESVRQTLVANTKVASDSIRVTAGRTGQDYEINFRMR